MEIYIVLFCLFAFLILIGECFLIFRSFKIRQDRINAQRDNINKQVDRVTSSISELSPEDFFRLRNSKNGYGIDSKTAGVYILHNKSKNMYYVGQGKDLFNRVNSHFTGKGNGDVYADYKCGDEFTIKMIALERSGFSTLNELERYAISRYDAFNKGYNRTRGNRG